MLGPFNVDLADFNVSEEHGFLPNQFPLDKFHSDYYSPWEDTVRILPQLLQTQSLRLQVNTAIPILSTSNLNSQSEWRRAYMLLSFLTHAYIWEKGGPSQILPPQISIPMLKVSAHLGLPPTATYAALNLWNFAPVHEGSRLSDVDNLRSLYTFTGTKDEEWFYLISVAIEAHGASVIRCMLDAMDAVRANETSTVTDKLIQFSHTIHECGVILNRMDEHCRPAVFYNKIRPFLAGSKNMQVAGLPNGVWYDIGNEKGEWRTYSGGSNAQSSLIQFFDIVLGVQHHPTVTRSPGVKHPTIDSSKGGNSYLQEMRNYMPEGHRNFLQHLESIANIRDFVSRSADSSVNFAFNQAVRELAKFRSIHIAIVTKYIINQSKEEMKKAKVQGSMSATLGMNLAVASSAGGIEDSAQRGTGGTQLLPFLNQSRDETRATKLDLPTELEE